MALKIAMAQVKSNPGDFKGNTAKVIEYIEKAKEKGVDLVVFPELVIPGYTSMDLFLEKGYARKSYECVLEVAKHTQGIMAVAGFVDLDESQTFPDGTNVRYNSAAIMRDGELVGVQDKTLLPEYDIFSEQRYFARSRGVNVVEYKGERIGVQICEDMWDEYYADKVSANLVREGVTTIVNLSASPYEVGKLTKRKNLISRISRELGVNFLYANLVGSYDGYDGQVVFDGTSLAYNLEGRLVACGQKFVEDFVMVGDGEVEVIEDEMHDIYTALVTGIRDYVRGTGHSKVFIGLSGGIDSALVAPLAVAALGRENVKGITMPSKFSSTGSVLDAKALAKNLGIEFSCVPIKDSYDAIVGALAGEFEGLGFDVTEENLQARIRGMILMAEANKFGGMVLSTGNKTEMALGYCTLYGDMNGGLSVLSDLDKLKVYELARYINRDGEVIPWNSINKAPSAELAPDQVDEVGLGAPYETLVPLVNAIVENRACKEELYDRFSRELVDKIHWRIYAQEFKRRQAPPGIRITSKAFGIGRRVPLVYGRDW